MNLTCPNRIPNPSPFLFSLCSLLFSFQFFQRCHRQPSGTSRMVERWETGSE
jgi:hypothetical protein